MPDFYNNEIDGLDFYRDDTDISFVCSGVTTLVLGGGGATFNVPLYGDGSNLTGISGGSFTGGTVPGATTFVNGVTISGTSNFNGGFINPFNINGELKINDYNSTGGWISFYDATNVISGEMYYDDSSDALYFSSYANKDLYIGSGRYLDLQSTEGTKIRGGGTGATLTVTQTSTGPSILVEDSATPDSTPFIVDTSGNVGIGATSPTEKLEVNGTIKSTALTATTVSATTYYMSDPNKYITGPVGSIMTISSGSNSMTFRNSTNPFMRGTSGGLGIEIASTPTIDTSAILTLTTTSKGFLPPRLTTTEKNAIVSPATGLMVWDSTLSSESYYNGSSWTNRNSLGNVTATTIQETFTGLTKINSVDSYFSIKNSLTTTTRYSPITKVYSFTGVQAVGGRLYVTPFILAESDTITKVGVEVTTTGASASVYIGIYQLDSNYLPTGAPLITSTALAATTTGLKEYTLSATTTLNKGVWYGTAILSDVTISVRGTLTQPYLGGNGGAQGNGAYTATITPGFTSLPSSPTMTGLNANSFTPANIWCTR